MTACERMNEAAVQWHREWAREVRIRSQKASSGWIQGKNGGDGRQGRRRDVGGDADEDIGVCPDMKEAWRDAARRSRRSRARS
ncbi:hypothetical protein TRIUR3_14440 [Triticum urartu]|uniref:Uncharacterized protein n=1 Tax=Triticum urartu TaxID=4572 RepID=M7Z4Q5_TRIUA|nr:hypothetical protein TRIUR3_14440 [Triticum urartu]